MRTCALGSSARTRTTLAVFPSLWGKSRCRDPWTLKSSEVRRTERRRMYNALDRALFEQPNSTVARLRRRTTTTSWQQAQQTSFFPDVLYKMIWQASIWLKHSMARKIACSTATNLLRFRPNKTKKTQKFITIINNIL